MVDENKMQLRAHPKVDYFEEFSSGDQEDYVIGAKEHSFKLPAKRKRSKKKATPKDEECEKDPLIEDKAKPAVKRSGKDKTSRDKGKKELADGIIQLSELNSRTQVTNSDIMLCLLEICLNSEKYGITLDNSSRSFWENVSQSTELFHSLRRFKPETLRKYWRRMRLTFKYKKLVDAIKANQNKLNSDSLKLLSAINAICDFISNPSKGLDAYINKYSAKKVKKNVQIEDSLNKNETDNEEESQENTVNSHQLESLKEMVELLSKCYPNQLKAILYQKLIEVSGNVENAFLYIKHPNVFSYLAFSKEEDEVIRANNDDSPQFKALLQRKGYDLIKQRKAFLTE